MAYQSFQTINEALPRAVRTGFARAIIQAQSSADAVVSVATSAISEYARLYSQVQRLKYDTAGNVTDVTPVNELTVPQSSIATLKQSMNDLKKLITWYGSMPDELTVDAFVADSIEIGGHNFPKVGFSCETSFRSSWGPIIGIFMSSSDHGVIMVADSNGVTFKPFKLDGQMLYWGEFTSVPNTTSGAWVIDFYQFAGVADNEYRVSLRGSVDLDQIDYSTLANSDARGLTTPLSALVSRPWALGGSLSDHITARQLSQQTAVEATFNIAQALKAVIDPYQDLIAAIENL